MVRLVPMTEEEFEAFMLVSMRDQAQGQVQPGAWRAEKADRTIERMRSQMLPDGLATPGHSFFTLEAAGTGAKVGGLWYVVEEEDGKRQIFVMDIQVHAEHRRHGYGSQAFMAMEDNARTMGTTRVALHVFEHNHAARALYAKLGYVGTGTMMAKEIGEQAG